MLYLTCTTISSVDLAYCGVSRAKDWVSVDCGTSINTFDKNLMIRKSLLNIWRLKNQKAKAHLQLEILSKCLRTRKKTRTAYVTSVI